MNRAGKRDDEQYALEVRERAVRMLLDHEREHASRWATVVSIAGKIGCAAQTLHEWVKKTEVDQGVRGGMPSEVAAKLKARERENRELRQANDTLRKTTPYFAQAELDPPPSAFQRCCASPEPCSQAPPVQAMIAFIDDQRAVYGVEPICKVLPIAPST